MLQRLADLDVRKLILDLALVIAVLSVFVSGEVVIWFHVVFLLIVLASFTHDLRPLLYRAIPAAIGVFAGLLLALARDEIPADELNELPILSAVVILVYFTVTKRQRLTAEVEAQKDTIDEIHRASQRELQDQLLLTQRLQINDRLSATVAHDVNNILSAMQLAAESLADGLVDADGTQRTGRELGECVQRAGGILSELVGTARIANRVAPQPPADLARVMNSITPMLQRLCGDTVDLTVTHKGASGRLGIPRLRLEQVLVNLTINAIDAADSVNAEIRITSRIEDDEAVITVADNGHGIPPEIAEHIFEPLYTSKSDTGGSGLGLFAAREFIEDASGSIEVESQAGRGTLFELRIPVILTPDDHAPANQSLSPSARRLALRVLLADDDRSIRLALSQGLRAAGHNVTVAADGEAAQNLISTAAEEFDVLVLDAMMPGVSGLDLIQILGVEHPDLPILLMSGYERLEPQINNPDQTVRFRRKPFAVADLLTDLQILADGRR